MDSGWGHDRVARSLHPTLLPQGTYTLTLALNVRHDYRVMVKKAFVGTILIVKGGGKFLEKNHKMKYK